SAAHIDGSASARGRLELTRHVWIRPPRSGTGSELGFLHAEGADEAAASEAEAVALVIAKRLRGHVADTAHAHRGAVAIARDTNRGLLGREPVGDQARQHLEGAALLSGEDRLELASLVIARSVVEVEARGGVAVEQRRPRK